MLSGFSYTQNYSSRISFGRWLNMFWFVYFYLLLLLLLRFFRLFLICSIINYYLKENSALALPLNNHLHTICLFCFLIKNDEHTAIPLTKLKIYSVYWDRVSVTFIHIHSIIILLYCTYICISPHFSQSLTTVCIV